MNISQKIEIVNTEALTYLKGLPESFVDSCVTDPPYELGFMNKSWDKSEIAFSVEFWSQVLRVLKPGGHLLAFGGPRRYYRMGSAIEDAGFEIRDSLDWIYGTGFPKSLNVSTAIDEAAGVKRKSTEPPVTDAARQWQGWGTGLKPAHEPIIMARKPLAGTVAANVQTYGTGALNIDACRIGDAGRWPANLLLDEQAAAELDAQAPATGARARVKGTEPSAASTGTVTNVRARVPGVFHGDVGGASRFFFVAKPSRKERDLGCGHLPERTGGEATDREENSAGVSNPRAGAGRTGGARNYHPTVKPVKLMCHLVRLVTPPGGLVLDPFVGSGTTALACAMEELSCLGLELSPEYTEIARARAAAKDE